MVRRLLEAWCGMRRDVMKEIRKPNTPKNTGAKAARGFAGCASEPPIQRMRQDNCIPGFIPQSHARSIGHDVELDRSHSRSEGHIVTTNIVDVRTTIPSDRMPR